MKAAKPKAVKPVRMWAVVWNDDLTIIVDCALRLIPDGPWNGEISWNFGELRIGGWVELNKANPAWLVPDYDPSQPPHEHEACVDSYSDQEPNRHKPRPLALAICIAALKARLPTDATAKGDGE